MTSARSGIIVVYRYVDLRYAKKLRPRAGARGIHLTACHATKGKLTNHEKLLHVFRSFVRRRAKRNEMKYDDGKCERRQDRGRENMRSRNAASLVVLM